MSAARQHHPQQADAAQRRLRAKTLRSIADPHRLAVTRRLNAAMRLAGVKQPELCRALGLKPGNGNVGRWCSLEEPQTMPWHVVERLRTALPRLHAALQQLDTPTEVNQLAGGCLISLSMRATKIEGDFRDALVEALADGVIDTHERRQLMELLGRVNRKWRAKAAILTQGESC